MGDFNAKVGRGNGEACMGKFGTELEMKENKNDNLTAHQRIF